MFDYYEALSQEDKEKLQDLIQLLYKQTFLLERKYDRKSGRVLVNKDFYFCELHMEFLKWYFSVAGFLIIRNTVLGTIYIQGQGGLGERLPKLATIYLLLLKLIYDEQMASVSSSVNVMTTFGELGSKVGEFSLTKNISSMTEIKRALSVLRKYQLIELMDSLEELEERSRIIVYPCVNVVLMREDIVRLLDSFGDEEQEGNSWLEPEVSEQNHKEEQEENYELIHEESQEDYKLSHEESQEEYKLSHEESQEEYKLNHEESQEDYKLHHEESQEEYKPSHENNQESYVIHHKGIAGEMWDKPLIAGLPAPEAGAAGDDTQENIEGEDRNGES